MLNRIEAIARAAAAADPAHDFSHCRRVLRNALAIARHEGGDPDVLAAAAYLHDIANLPKNHPDSRLSSERSAKRAAEIASELGMDEERVARLEDAVLCHSFSRGLTPRTLEGRVFQDADRLDALGAIGIARTFAVAGALGTSLYGAEDPFLRRGREPDDKRHALDHFEVKLFRLAERMQTQTGRRFAEERVRTMRQFVSALESEIGD